MRFFVASHILSIFWAWHCSKCIEKSNRTILCSQHAQKRESTNSLMPYYGLNIKVIVHSHKYQPVRGHWFFLMHLKLLCLHLCIIAHWLADKMTWHKRWLIRFNILFSILFWTFLHNKTNILIFLLPIEVVYTTICKAFLHLEFPQLSD